MPQLLPPMSNRIASGTPRVPVSPEPRPIREMSIRQRVFIYNPSPWHYKQDMGSLGSKFIPALDEKFVCALGDHEYDVAGPLVVEGLPSETYPREGGAERQYHRPLVDNPGLDLAQEICGVGIGRSMRENIIERGIFISHIAESYEFVAEGVKTTRYRAPKKPKGNADGETRQRWETWLAEFREAQGKLRAFCGELCLQANDAHAKGRFGDIRADHHFQAAKIIKKTSAECPWMEGSYEASQRVSCPFCGGTVQKDIPKCIHCKEQLVSDEEMKRIRTRYLVEPVASPLTAA